MDSDPDETDKLRSFEIDRIHELFDDNRFPVTTDVILSEFGDVSIDYPGGGDETLQSVLETSSKEEYETMDDLQLAVMNGVQRDAVGRPRYSDRDPPDVAEEHDEKQSF